MDKFLDYIEKFKFAIFGTIIIHFVIFFLSIFTSIQDVSVVPNDAVSISIPLDDIELEPEIEEILGLNKDNNQILDDVSNLTSDENDTRDRSYEDYSPNLADNESKKTVAELEAEYFENAKNNNERSEIAAQTEIHEIKEKNTNQKTTNANNAYGGNVMISYNLKGRKEYKLPNPGYTCNGSGKVVIQIKVDKAGKVKDVSFLPAQSIGATECMVAKAKHFARRSEFDYNSSQLIQTGTITYQFVGR